MAEAPSAPASAVPAPAAPAPTLGVVLVAGSVSHSMSGRSAPPAGFDGIPETNLYRFNVFEGLPSPLSPATEGQATGITQIITGPTASHYGAIDNLGGLWMWGRNEKGQLGVGHTKNIYKPQKVLNNVVTAAVARQHTLVVNKDGEVYVAGEGRMGQTGLGPQRDVSHFTRVNAGITGKKITAGKHPYCR
jgi:hypothetical protein